MEENKEMRSVILAEDGHIQVSADVGTLTYGQFDYAFPVDFDFGSQHHYRIEGGAGGKLIYDPLPEPEPVPDVLDEMISATIDNTYRLILLEMGM